MSGHSPSSAISVLLRKALSDAASLIATFRLYLNFPLVLVLSLWLSKDQQHFGVVLSYTVCACILLVFIGLQTEFGFQLSSQGDTQSFSLTSCCQICEMDPVRFVLGSV